MIALSDKLRTRHLHILGKTQVGKTTLMLNMVRQDMEQGKGVIFIDPHGDPAELFLKTVPESRLQDVIYFEPVHYPLGLGSLVAKDPLERDFVMDDAFTLFNRFSHGEIGDRMDAVLRYTLSALLALPDSTFLDIHYFLSNDAFRQMKVAVLPDSSAKDYWRPDPRQAKEAAGFITSRTVKIAESGILAPILGTKDTIDLNEVMDHSKILIVNLGHLGADAKALIGTLVTSRIQTAAFRRAALPERMRTPVYMYIDEFHEFATPSFANVFSGAAKFRLYLTVAHQNRAQLGDELKASVGIAGTTILFPLYPDDVDYYERAIGYEPPKTKSFVGAHHTRTHETPGRGHTPRTLEKYQAIIFTDGKTYFTKTYPLEVGRSFAEAIKENSKKYAPKRPSQVPRRNVPLEAVEPDEPQKSPPPLK